MNNISPYTLILYTTCPDPEKLELSLKKYYYNYNIEFHNNEDFHFKDFYPDRTFILCDSDHLIEEAKESGLPVIAVSHSMNRGESLFNTTFLLVLKDDSFSEHLLTPDDLEIIYCRHYQLPLTVAQTDRLILRELTMADLEELVDLDMENIQDSDALFFPPEYLLSQIRDLHCESFLKKYISNQYLFFNIGFYAIIDRNSEDFIGLIGFNTPDDDSIEVGYSLKKIYRRQGIATEALGVLLDYFRALYPCLPLRVTLKKDNTASRKLAEKFGIPCFLH